MSKNIRLVELNHEELATISELTDKVGIGAMVDALLKRAEFEHRVEVARNPESMSIRGLAKNVDALATARDQLVYAWVEQDDDPPAYEFQAYDVLQIKRPDDNRWSDFSTLRSDEDAAQAVELVNGGRWDGQPAEFRIRRGFNYIVYARA